MTHEQILAEIISLPPEYQSQVVDFITSIRQRCIQPISKAQSNSISEEEGFAGIWQDRKDLKDSSAWVRNLRQSEWT